MKTIFRGIVIGFAPSHLGCRHHGPAAGLRFTGGSFLRTVIFSFPYGPGPGGFRRTEVVYVFGECRLDLDRRELWRGGAQIGLEPLVFDLLAYLCKAGWREA